MASCDYRKILDEAVQMTMGEMAFIDAVPLKDHEDEINAHQIIYLDFQEPARGWIALFFPLELKQQIAENIYAQDWGSLNLEEIDDCFLELLNVLGGNYLNLLAGEHSRHNIAFPQVLFDESEIPDDKSAITAVYDGEGIPFLIKMAIEDKREDAV